MQLHAAEGLEGLEGVEQHGLRLFEIREKAERMGIVERVLDAESGEAFLEAVLALAGGYCPPHKAGLSVGLIKRAVQSGADLPLESGLALERELQQRLFQSADAREGLAAFEEKRAPQFEGR